MSRDGLCEDLAKQAHQMRENGTYKVERILESAQAAHIQVSGGRHVINRRSVRSCALPLKPVDATFAPESVNKHATTLCDDLRFNVCGTVVRGATGSLDLLGHFAMCL